MRQKFLATFIVFAFLIGSVLPFVDLSAAELWNKQSEKTEKGQTKYYNAPKSTISKKRSLYNTGQNQGKYKQGIIGQVENTALGKVKKVSIGKQVTSKLFGFMSPSAVDNRTTDVQNALQISYEQQKNNMKALAQMRVDDARILKQLNKEHKKRVAKYHADKKAGKKQTAEQRMKELSDVSNSGSESYTGSFRAEPVEQKSSVQQKKLYNTVK